MNLMKKTVRAAVAALAMALPGALQAATIYDTGWNSATFTSANSWCSDCGFGTKYQAFAKFTLDTSALVTSATWVSTGTFLSEVVLEIWDQSRSSLLFSQATATSDITNTSRGFAVDRTMSVSGLLLSSGTYWISFSGPKNLFYSYGNETGEFVQTVNGSNVSPRNGRGAFRLEGGPAVPLPAVPLPATLPLLAAAFAGFGLLRRKRLA